MFNFKKQKIAVDLTQKIKPQNIPGNTLEEKVAYISQQLDEKIGQAFENGQISEAQVYKLLTDKKIETENDFKFLEQYRANIENLRKIAGDLIRAEGASLPTDAVVDSIINKLLQRTGTIFIPALVRLHRVTSRTEELVNPLLEYSKPEEIVVIQNFISSEIQQKREEVRNEFLSIFQNGRVFSPDFTMDHYIFIFDHDLVEISQNPDIPLTPTQVKEIKDLLNALETKVIQMNSNIRIWNRILEVHPKIENREKWAALIPESLRIEWRLESILRYFEYPISKAPAEKRIRDTGIQAQPEIVSKSRKDDIFYYFYPETDDYGKPLVDDQDKRIYALSKLKDCIENGYDNERIFDLIGYKVKTGPRQKKRTREEIERSKEEEKLEIQETPVTQADARDKFGEKIRYYFKNLLRLGSTSSVFDPSTRLATFRQDVRDSGLPHVAELLGKAYEKPEDSRYKDFDLKFLSAEEMNICEVLRRDYNLDPIPFPVKIPCPVDNPTSTDRFEIDFLLPCDVLVGFEEEETFTLENPATGEGRSEIIRKPIIESRVMFIGEYFGIRFTTEKKIEDKGRPWVRPSGEIPIYDYPKAKNGPARYIVAPNGYCRELEFYKLKTEWKMFTTEILADILGTRALSLDDSDLDYPSNLMSKLDAARIIYKSPECSENKGCMAYKEIMKQATPTQEIRKYVEEDAIKENFDNHTNRCIKIIDCAIANIKLTDVMMRAKQEYVNRDEGNKPGFYNQGFNRKTMYEHQQLMAGLREREQFLSRQLAVKGDEETRNKLDDLRNEIKNLYSSPLYDFKEYVQSIMSSGTISQKIKDLEEMKNLIESGKITPSFAELRSMIINVSPDLIANIHERGAGVE